MLIHSCERNSVTGTMGYTESCRFLLLNVFAHVGGQVFDFLVPLFNGVNIVMGRNPGYVGQLDLIQKYKITHINPAPNNLNFWAKYDHLENHDLSSLKYILIGSACPNFDLIEIFVQRAGLNSSVKLRNTYGATETASCTFCQNEFIESDIRSIGLAAPGVSFKIINPEDESEVVTEPETEGELAIKLHNEQPLYFNDPEKSNKALTSDGFYKTGDLVNLDERFQVFLSGRTSDFIKYCGFTVPPVLLEQIVMESNLVVDCAVVGKPDEINYEIPVACVVLSDLGKNMGKVQIEQELLDHVASQIQECRKIRGVEVVDEIPRNPNEKIMRRVLVEQICQH